MYPRFVKYAALTFFFLFLLFLIKPVSGQSASANNHQKSKTQQSDTPSVPSAVAPAKPADKPADKEAKEYPVSVSKIPDVTVRRDLLDWLMLACTIILACAAVVGTYYAVKTLRVLRHEAKIAVAALKQTAKFANAASRNAEAAKISADTSQKTLALASDTAEKQLRAYVCVESACVKFPSPQVPEAQVHFKNYGQTPAYKFRGWIHTWFTEHPLTDVLPFAPDDLRKGTELLAPGRRSIFVTPRKPPFHPNYLEKLGTEKLTMYVYGEVYYTDAFGKDQWTKYRLIYGGPAGIRKVPGKEEWLLSPDTEGNEAS